VLKCVATLLDCSVREISSSPAPSEERFQLLFGDPAKLQDALDHARAHGSSFT
jgi:hypothetical protein